MSGRRYTVEFKLETVRQVIDRVYSLVDVAEWLSVTPKSLYDWIKRYGENAEQYQVAHRQEEERRRLRAELKRVTEERDILKKAAAYFAKATECSRHLSGPTRNNTLLISSVAC